MRPQHCYICIYSDYENKEYYLTEIDNEAAIRALGRGYIWGSKKDALIFASKNSAKSYLVRGAYIKNVQVL